MRAKSSDERFLKSEKGGERPASCVPNERRHRQLLTLVKCDRTGVCAKAVDGNVFGTDCAVVGIESCSISSKYQGFHLVARRPHNQAVHTVDVLDREP